jgi:predicted glutamine amidotransferase
MCRLFGLSGGHEPLTATFWLLDAPDSLSAQSHREPDGTGIGIFDEHGRARVMKQPSAAYEDQAFATEAKELHAKTFVAHIRYASNGGLTLQNTHPFEMDGRLFAHNGVIGDVEALDAELGASTAMVKGDTDSERFFALITRGIERGATPGEAIIAAAQWIAANLPVFALNCILTTPDELYALRYPETHELHVLERPAGGDHLRHAGTHGTVRVHSEHLADRPSVVVASEPMDDDPGWRMLDSGALLRVDADLNATVTAALTAPPARPLSLADLAPGAASSQAAR